MNRTHKKHNFEIWANKLWSFEDRLTVCLSKKCQKMLNSEFKVTKE